MNREKIEVTQGGKFHLSKWFLDFVGENGEAMIFYSARLTWCLLSISYTSWLSYDPISGVDLKSRIGKAQNPKIDASLITWEDSKLGISGIWKPKANMIKTRIFDSEEGFVDWNCFQPASKVSLKINDKLIDGSGYAEQLIITLLSWKIPMDELKWGHFSSSDNNMVWIELKEKEKRQWLSKCQLQLEGKNLSRGMAIHEFVNFKSFTA